MPSGRARRARTLLAVASACGLVVAGFGIVSQSRPRQLTSAQRARVEAWEVAARWRTMSKARLFPAQAAYAVPIAEVGADPSIGGPQTLHLTASRLGIAGEATCVQAAGVSRAEESVLARDGCLALLRGTYADSSGSLVVTAGIAVLRSPGSAAAVLGYLTGQAAAGIGSVTRQPVLEPLAVPGSPAYAFGASQRQLSWAVAAGPYLVITTVGYADGRGRVPVAGDTYIVGEITSLAQGIAADIAAPLGARPPVPHCPGGPGC
jgi:hypothetical protein